MQVKQPTLQNTTKQIITCTINEWHCYCTQLVSLQYIYIYSLKYVGGIAYHVAFIIIHVYMYTFDGLTVIPLCDYT